MFLAQLLHFLVQIYELILIARVLMSWVRPDPYHPLVRWIERVTEPVLMPVRRALPTNHMGIDFSPLVILAVLWLLRRFILPVVF